MLQIVFMCFTMIFVVFNCIYVIAWIGQMITQKWKYPIIGIGNDESLKSSFPIQK